MRGYNVEEIIKLKCTTDRTGLSCDGKDFDITAPTITPFMNDINYELTTTALLKNTSVSKMYTLFCWEFEKGVRGKKKEKKHLLTFSS